jgi:hypothetical protein
MLQALRVHQMQQMNQVLQVLQLPTPGASIASSAFGISHLWEIILVRTALTLRLIK